MSLYGNNTEGLLTMSKVAKRLSISPQWFWSLVRTHKTLPSPGVKVGNRLYYTEEQAQEAIDTYHRLKTKKGGAK